MDIQYGSALVGATVGAISAWILTYIHQNIEDSRHTLKAKQILFYFIESYLNNLETARIGGQHGTGDTYKFDIKRHIGLCDEHVLGCKSNGLVADYLAILDTLNWGSVHLEGYEVAESNEAKFIAIKKKHKLDKLKPKKKKTS